MGNVALDFQAKLLETLSSLPKSRQIEVLDFADFVRAKLESQTATEEILADSKAMARLKASEEDLKAGNVVAWRRVRKNV